MTRNGACRAQERKQILTRSMISNEVYSYACDAGSDIRKRGGWECMYVQKRRRGSMTRGGKLNEGNRMWYPNIRWEGTETKIEQGNVLTGVGCMGDEED